jgi:hypothetical protein
MAQNGTFVLGVSGVLIYAILSLSYSQFYGALGVSPSDVGLNYLNTLAGSVGIVLVILLLLLVIFVLCLIPVALIRLFLGGRRYLSDESFRKEITAGESGMIEPLLLVSALPSLSIWTIRQVVSLLKNVMNEARRYSVKVTVWTALVLVTVLAFYVLPRMATVRAQEATNGNAVLQPDLPLLPLTVLSVHADPVQIAPTGESGKTPAVDALKARSALTPPLLYLGQANSLVVLYDSTKEQAIYVPSSSVLVTVSNCRAQPQPPNC